MTRARRLATLIAALMFRGATGCSDATLGSLRREVHLTSLSPASVPAGAGPVTITLDGSGFTSTSEVRFNETPVPTIRHSGEKLTAEVRAYLLALPGPFQVYVSTGQGDSESLSFQVTGASKSGRGRPPAASHR